MTRRSLEASIEAIVGAAPRTLRPLAGGDVGQSHCAVLGDGTRLFVKHYPRGTPEQAAREAEGLAWLARAAALPVARVRGFSRSEATIVLDWIESAPTAPDHDERLGRGLAALHASDPGGFGLERDNFIGPLPQTNAPRDRWCDFYAENRLRPLFRRAYDAGRIPPEVRAPFERLLGAMGERCGPEEPPSRLHGDLWSGNVMRDETGGPCLIDPAVYGGHREVDLAMMRLFGGFSQRCFGAYAESHPLAPGAAERVPLYQLHPLLVHIVLFGGGYAESFARALRALG